MKHFPQAIVDDVRPLYTKAIDAWKALPDTDPIKAPSFKTQEQEAAFHLWFSTVLDADLNDLDVRLKAEDREEELEDKMALVTLLIRAIDCDRAGHVNFKLTDADDLFKWIGFMDLRTWAIMRFFELYFRTYGHLLEVPGETKSKAAKSVTNEAYAAAAQESLALYEDKANWANGDPVVLKILEDEGMIVQLFDQVFELYLTSPSAYDRYQKRILTEEIPEEIKNAELIAPQGA